MAWAEPAGCTVGTGLRPARDVEEQEDAAAAAAAAASIIVVPARLFQPAVRWALRCKGSSPLRFLAVCP